MAEEDRVMAVQKAAKKAEKDTRRVEREVSVKKDIMLCTYVTKLM